MQLTATGLEHRFTHAAAPAVRLDRLTARSGELLAVAGPSGSGKTTLLYLLSGLLKPATGTVTWDRLNLANLSETARDRWRRRHAGFIFQNFHLVAEMTPLQNVTIAAYFGGWSASQYSEHAAALLERLGIPAEARPARTFSRGEQQRIAIARALLFDPPILFADEPTASLDAASAEVCATQLLSLARNDGKSVLVVSHDPAVTSIADRVIRLDHGVIAGEAA